MRNQLRTHVSSACSRTRYPAPFLRAGIWLGASLLMGIACRDITSLTQENPGQLSAASVYVPANAQLLSNGVQDDFECAYSRYVLGTAIFSDELVNATAQAQNFDYDRRTLPSNAPYGTATCASSVQNPGVYTPLSAARASADTLVSRLEGWTDAEMPAGVSRTALIGRAAAYAGYSIGLLGEAMCSAAINNGPELTPGQLFAEAVTRFDKAIAAATAAGDAGTLDFALLGRARAQLNLGNSVAAAVDAAKITDSAFVVDISTSATIPRDQNVVFINLSQSGYSSVDPYYRSLTNDPRVASTNTGRIGTDGKTQIWTPTNKDVSLTSPIAVAKWSEAQLIIAENDVATGDLPGAIAIINVLHGRADVPSYNPANPAAAQVLAQVIEERRRELFLEGHRLGDIRRYNLALDPAPGTPYPSAPSTNGVWGSQTCFPLPDVERINNPNIGS